MHDEALVDLADKGRLWDPIKPAYFYKYDPTTEVLTPADPGSDPVDWFHFNGRWGDKRYTDSDPRQKPVPYFGLKKYDDGPTGPKFKHLVRKGLMPDEKEKTPLMKTLVHWYMSLYGCCLKGVNPWVVVISVLLVLAATVFLCVFAIRRTGPRLKDWSVKTVKRMKKKKQAGKEEDGSELRLRLLDPEGAEVQDDTRN